MENPSATSVTVEEKAVSVADRILESFLQAVEEDRNFSVIAGHLRKTLMIDRNHSETALMQAIFGDADQ